MNKKKQDGKGMNKETGWKRTTQNKTKRQSIKKALKSITHPVAF